MFIDNKASIYVKEVTKEQHSLEFIALQKLPRNPEQLPENHLSRQRLQILKQPKCHQRQLIHPVTIRKRSP